MTDASKILNEFPDHMGRPPIYPWDEWFDGQIRELVQGVDFQSEIASFRTLFHRTARKRSLKAKTRMNKDGHSVTVTVYDRKARI